MIIVNLKGGLGNQMFQYACGRALSLRSGDPELKLNTFGLEKANEVGDIYRPYSLANFNVKADLVTREELEKVANPYGIFSKIIRYTRAKYLHNYYTHFEPKVLTLRGDVYLDGYFQSEKYFAKYEKKLREDFKPKNLSDDATDWIQKIKNRGSAVSIHIRRGDYVGHKTLGGICTKEYYNKAINEITERVDSPKFFVFSDDVEWVKLNLDQPADAGFVSAQELKDYEELVIMSSCEHNIIANSSFSWWGAWLNSNKNKIVVAPREWTSSNSNANKDIVPQSWIKI